MCEFVLGKRHPGNNRVEEDRRKDVAVSPYQSGCDYEVEPFAISQPALMSEKATYHSTAAKRGEQSHSLRGGL